MSISKAGTLLLIGMALFLVSFVMAEIAYSGHDDWTAIDVIYMVVITVFGVGYGEVHPIHSPELKVWTIAIITTGCSSLFFIFGGFVQMLLETQFNKDAITRKMAKEIKNLTGHVIVVGYGRVGRLLVKELREANEEVVIVDLDADRLESRELKGVPVVIGDATEESVLSEAGIERASTIAVVLPNDALNVFITLSARNFSDDLQIIARTERVRTLAKLQQAGADHTVMPAHSGAERISRMILHPKSAQPVEDTASVMNQLSELGLDVEEVTVVAGSGMAGMNAKEIETRFDLLIVEIQREDKILKRKSDLVIEEKDGLTVIGHLGFQERLLVHN